eukprot:TRINITY_DN34043_c0_g1_i1.p1 TRINITY_DN34043_c0_g1~~TRINITY_DN34043_c0_g1_i1.p1  ORF type:complete len:311 (+),score=74.92 TRINITY_DN34043_c0_g1_i1:70-933(+)
MELAAPMLPTADTAANVAVAGEPEEAALPGKEEEVSLLGTAPAGDPGALPVAAAAAMQAVSTGQTGAEAADSDDETIGQLISKAGLKPSVLRQESVLPPPFHKFRGQVPPEALERMRRHPAFVQKYTAEATTTGQQPQIGAMALAYDDEESILSSEEDDEKKDQGLEAVKRKWERMRRKLGPEILSLGDADEPAPRAPTGDAPLTWVKISQGRWVQKPMQEDASVVAKLCCKKVLLQDAGPADVDAKMKTPRRKRKTRGPGEETPARKRRSKASSSKAMELLRGLLR